MAAGEGNTSETDFSTGGLTAAERLEVGNLNQQRGEKEEAGVGQEEQNSKGPTVIDKFKRFLKIGQ